VAAHNLATEAPPFAAGSCHVVFCRNVLIYFERDAAVRFLDRLHRHLPEGASLFLGASESLWHLSTRFQPERIGGAFVYRRRAHAPAAERLAPRLLRRAPVAVPPAPAARQPAAPRSAPAAAPAPALPAVEDLLAEGDRAAAARDYARAASAFRKAAYLDADDVRAPLGLGFALGATGDAAGARRAFRAARAALRRAGDDAALDGWAGLELARLLDAKLEDGRAAA
jgi:CheR methyltransferase, SAM binding domain